MQNQLIEQQEKVLKIAPESLEIAEVYLRNLDTVEVSRELGIPLETVVEHLGKREVQKFMDSIFFDQGYMNRHKMQHAIDTLIERKFEELDEAEMGSSKDIADLLKLAIDYRNGEIKNIQNQEKITTPQMQQNIQVNSYGENYKHLMNAILKGDIVK